MEAIIPRPTLPVSSPDLNVSNSSVHRYASRDLRTREAQAEIEKWDAWHACAGTSRTEAKRQYISTLIDTMKEYASGTSESRELVSELEFVWNQIKNQTGSDPDHRSSPSNNSQGSGSKESPTRVMERAGLARSQSQMNSMSFSSNRPSMGSEDRAQSKTQTRLKRTESGLRVLSPVSQQDSNSIVEPVDAEDENRDYDDDDDDDDQNLNTAPTSPLIQRSNMPGLDADSGDLSHSLAEWQANLERHLHALKTEIAALREQLSANHLLSSSSFSHTYYTLSTRQRILHRAKMYIRTFGLTFLKQLGMQLGVLALVLLWGRFNQDLRVENKTREIISKIWQRFKTAVGGIFLWLLDLFSREGRLGFIGRLLRIT